MKNKTEIILIVGSVIVLASFIANRFLVKEAQLNAESLSAIYTGLGFVGLLATLWHERDEAKGAEKEHRDLLASMAKQTAASYYHTRYLAKVYRYERVRAEWQKTQVPHGSEKILEQSKKLAEEIHKLQSDLDRFSDTTPE